MQLVSLNPSENTETIIRKVVSSGWNCDATKDSQIKQGMTPGEIADITSDHLIEIVRKQFEATKQALQANSGH